MLKALERRCEAEEDKLSSGLNQLPVASLATADSEFDVGSSSTSCADSGRGLSCEVHDEPAKTLTAPGRGTEPLGRSSDPLARNLDSLRLSSRRGTEPVGRENEHLDALGRSLKLLGRITEPAGRNMETFGRGMDPVERNVDHVGRGPEVAGQRGNTMVTVQDTLMAHTAALDACRQPPSRSTANVVGNVGM